MRPAHDRWHAVAVTTTPFLMFQGDAEQWLDLVLSTVPGSRLVSMERREGGAAGVEGGVAMAFVEIDGLLVRLFDSPVGHAFTFTPAFSFFVDVSSVADHELIHAALADGGTVLMAPADHGFSQWFSWVQDRYGVSWQLNVA